MDNGEFTNAGPVGTNNIIDRSVTIEKIADNAIDDEPTAGSNNLVKSGGVANKLAKLEEQVIYKYYENLETSEQDKVLDVSLTAGKVIVTFTNNSESDGYCSAVFNKNENRVAVATLPTPLSSHTSKTIEVELTSDVDTIIVKNPNRINLSFTCNYSDVKNEIEKLNEAVINQLATNNDIEDSINKLSIYGYTEHLLPSDTEGRTVAVSIPAGKVNIEFINESDASGYATVIFNKNGWRVAVVTPNVSPMEAKSRELVETELESDVNEMILRNMNGLDITYKIVYNDVKGAINDINENIKKLEDNTISTKPKIIEYKEPTNRGFIDSKGEILTSDDYLSYVYSDEIEISYGDTITIGSVFPDNGFHLYDKNHNHIAALTKDIVIKSDDYPTAKYFRYCKWYQGIDMVVITVNSNMQIPIIKFVEGASYSFDVSTENVIDVKLPKGSLDVTLTSSHEGYATLLFYNKDGIETGRVAGILLQAGETYKENIKLTYDTERVLVKSPNGIMYNVKLSGESSLSTLYNYVGERNLKNTIIVDSKGEGDYISLMDALKYAQDSPTNHVTILVRPGRYRMVQSEYDGYRKDGINYYEPNGRNLSIIGTDRNSCILYNDIGYYDANKYDNSVLALGGNCTVANFTLISSHDRREEAIANHSDWNMSYPTSYCIHLDANPSRDGDVIEIINCKMINKQDACIGCGTRKNYSIVVKSCECISTFPNEVIGTSSDWKGPFAAHNDGRYVNTDESVPNQIVHIEDCIFTNTNSYIGIALTQINGKQSNNFITYRLIRNVVKTTDTNNALYISGQYQVKDDMSFGNNVESMNT